MCYIVNVSKLLALTLFVLSLSANADEWSTADKQREFVYMALHLMDWAQTRNIARNSDKWREINPILGEHPSEDKVDAYFAVMALAHIAISDALRSKYRDT